MKLMNKFLNSIKSKGFWNEILNTAKLFVILGYLRELKDADNVWGFWVVIFIFSFQPIYELMKAKPWHKK